MKKYIKKNFLLYDFLLKILLILKRKISLKVLFHNTKKDLVFNLDNLKKINEFSNFLPEKTDDIFKYDFRYAIFEELIKLYMDKNPKILEIGTFKGEFANYLAKKFKNSEVTTIELKKTDPRFIQTYGRNNDELRKNFLNNRHKNLQLDNIKLIEMDSFHLLEVFQKDTFDIIWVDGHHLDPTVSKDLFSSHGLVKKNGFVVVDDVYKIDPPNPNCSKDSFLVLENLQKEKGIKFYLLNKFVRPTNYKVNPYIAFFRNI